MIDNNRVIPIFIDSKHTIIKIPKGYHFYRDYFKKMGYTCNVCLKKINEKNAFFIEAIIPNGKMVLNTKYYCNECGSKTTEYINYMFEKIK